MDSNQQVIYANINSDAERNLIFYDKIYKFFFNK